MDQRFKKNGTLKVVPDSTTPRKLEEMRGGLYPKDRKQLKEDENSCPTSVPYSSSKPSDLYTRISI